MTQKIEAGSAVVAEKANAPARAEYQAPLLLVLDLSRGTSAGSFGSAEGGFTHS